MHIVNYATRRCAGWGSRGRWEQEELLGTLLGSLLDLHWSVGTQMGGGRFNEEIFIRGVQKDFEGGG